MADYYTPNDDYASLSPAQRSERQRVAHRAMQMYAPTVCQQCGKPFVVAAPDNPNVCFNCGDTELTEQQKT